MSDAKTVHEAMILAAAGIGAVAKNLENRQSMYNARSIDDILDAVHGPLHDAGVVLVPRVVQRLTDVRGKMNYVAVEVEYQFVGPDGSSLMAVVWGEATDASDKATNKAMSAALKTCMIQTFTIPVHGNDDADSQTVEAVPNLAGENEKTELRARLEQMWETVGSRGMPREWKAAGLPPIAELPESRVGDAFLALEAAELRVRRQFPESAERPVGGRENVPVADGGDLAACEVCGLVGAHESGCPEGDE